MTDPLRQLEDLPILVTDDGPAPATIWARGRRRVRRRRALGGSLVLLIALASAALASSTLGPDRPMSDVRAGPGPAGEETGPGGALPTPEEGEVWTPSQTQERVEACVARRGAQARPDCFDEVHDQAGPGTAAVTAEATRAYNDALFGCMRDRGYRPEDDSSDERDFSSRGGFAFDFPDADKARPSFDQDFDECGDEASAAEAAIWAPYQAAVDAGRRGSVRMLASDTEQASADGTYSVAYGMPFTVTDESGAEVESGNFGYFGEAIMTEPPGSYTISVGAPCETNWEGEVRANVIVEVDLDCE